jgi:membrane associated rhomboid family serine protease
MRQAPPVTALPRFPVTGGTALLAVGVTIVWMTKAVGIDPLMPSALIQRGQVWRLLTCTLPHAGLLHLAFNCYWLWVFGTLLEGAWGSVATAGTFVLLGVGSSAAEFAALNGGVGLSGVGYGLFGLLWVLGRREDRFANAVNAQTANLFLVWFFICIFTTYAGIFPVANIAHGVGLALGAGLGVAVGRGWSRPARAAAGAGVGLLLVVGLVGSTVLRPCVNRSADAANDNARQGYLALEDHRDADAVPWLLDAARMGPRVAGTWFNLGLAYQRTGNETAAQAAYARAHELDPSNAAYRAAAE